MKIRRLEHLCNGHNAMQQNKAKDITTNHNAAQPRENNFTGKNHSSGKSFNCVFSASQSSVYDPSSKFLFSILETAACLRPAVYSPQSAVRSPQSTICRSVVYNLQVRSVVYNLQVRSPQSAV